MSLLTDQAGEHLGDGGQHTLDLQEGEDAGEVVHGLVRTGVQLHSSDSQISNHVSTLMTSNG